MRFVIVIILTLFFFLWYLLASGAHLFAQIVFVRV